MMSCINNRITVGLAIIGLILIVSPCNAQFYSQDSSSKSQLVDKVQGAEIDWGNEYYYATGEGVMPSSSEEPNRAKAFLKAKGYGKMKAIANLLMAIEGTTISYKAIGKDFIAKDETLKQTIEGFVANVEVVGEKQQVEGSDTIVVVTVKAPMFGAKGPGTAILRSKLQNEMFPSNIPADLSVDKRKDAAAATALADVKGPFSSLIVDCGNLNVARAMSPKIRRNDGSEVWGTVKVDYDFLQEHGIVVYAQSLEEAKRNSRAGSNPLVLKAIGRAGGRFMCDAVISDADAERVGQENQATHFMDKFNVIFVVDGN